MERNEKIARGDHAKSLLGSEVFTNILEELLAESFGQFAATDPLNQDDREKCYDDTRALHRVTERLEHYVSDAEQEIRNAEFDKNL